MTNEVHIYYFKIEWPDGELESPPKDIQPEKKRKIDYEWVLKNIHLFKPRD